MIFVDSSAFYALADGDDRHHQSAKDFYRAIITSRRLITTDYILLECWYLLESRLNRDAAIAFWDGLRSGIVEMIKVELQDLEQARGIIERFSDQTFSLVDATSFALMEREGLLQVFTFDAHFRIYRFGEGNRRYFEVFPP
ncbi:MAG TPA: PIN domain-containing protein [Candidatus Fraserbacteria bacterium]|nr:PIN domain-containing protein [Candidatus Fraserbacteria bacterium]